MENSQHANTQLLGIPDYTMLNTSFKVNTFYIQGRDT